MRDVRPAGEEMPANLSAQRTPFVFHASAGREHRASKGQAGQFVRFDTQPRGFFDGFQWCTVGTDALTHALKDRLGDD